MPAEWVNRWNDVIAAKPDLPGVWRRRDGGYRVRGRVSDPKTGQMRGVNRALPACKRAREAAAELEAELGKIRAGTGPAKSDRAPRFDEWATTVFARKVQSGAIASAAGRAKWEAILRLHLIPAFGPIFIDQLTREDVEAWRTHELLGVRAHAKDERRERKLEAGRYSPQTVNTILGVLRQVTAEASAAFNVRDACASIDNASTRGHRTYTFEEPNAVRPADVPRFLGEMRVRHPDHYAFVFLGFTTGLRPSSLRPLRWRGPNADIKWDEGVLLVRRSQTVGAEAMESTKTDRDQVIALDPEQLAVLRWHLDRHEKYVARCAEKPETLAIAEAMRASDLLFPSAPTRWSKGGGFRSRSCLDKPFAEVAKLLELGYDVSPRAMRRTFQDLARAGKVADVTTRAISGHATERMQQRYSSVDATEQRAALAKVIDIATGRERRAA